MKRVSLTVAKKLREFFGEFDQETHQGMDYLMHIFRSSVELFPFDSAGSELAAMTVRESHALEYTEPRIRALLGAGDKRHLLEGVHKEAARLTAHLSIKRKGPRATYRLRLEYWLAKRRQNPICRLDFLASPSGEDLRVDTALL